MNNIHKKCLCGSGIKARWCCKRPVPSKEDVKKKGMVFTPPKLVNEILNKLSEDCPNAFLGAKKTCLDPSCGDGNFLVEILNRRLSFGVSHLDAIKTIYGIDIDQQNIDTTKHRLALGSEDETIWFHLNHNIICADFLDEKHKGWSEVGYMWNKA